MNIELKKFGTVLTSRPSGKEAYLAAKAYVFPKHPGGSLMLDFGGVNVLSPSWADEFITPLKKEFPNLTMVNTDNLSVRATLEALDSFQSFE